MLILFSAVRRCLIRCVERAVWSLGWLTGFLEAAEMRSPFFIIEVVLTSFGLLADGVFIEHLRIVCAAAAAGIPV